MVTPAQIKYRANQKPRNTCLLSLSIHTYLLISSFFLSPWPSFHFLQHLPPFTWYLNSIIYLGIFIPSIPITPNIPRYLSSTFLSPDGVGGTYRQQGNNIPRTGPTALVYLYSVCLFYFCIFFAFFMIAIIFPVFHFWFLKLIKSVSSFAVLYALFFHTAARLCRPS